MVAYYNENNPYAAQWLRNLIEAGLIATGDVDERSIEDVAAADLAGYDQAHFFAGIGGWSCALRLAGWPDDRHVWTGSCPCQPFSSAGKRRGDRDERHLWPAWFRLIEECRPGVVFGEQVASAAGYGWLDAVHADLEGAEYAVGSVDICAAGVGAPHWRQRLWFVADANYQLGDEGCAVDGGSDPRSDAQQWAGPSRYGRASDMADADSREREGIPAGQGCNSDREAAGWEQGDGGAASDCSTRHMGHTDRHGLPSGWLAAAPTRHGSTTVADGSGTAARATNGFWRDADWLLCRDERWRPVAPGSFPLAHGVSGRVAVPRPDLGSEATLPATDERLVSRAGTLAGFGNAIVPQVAAEFISAYMEVA